MNEAKGSAIETFLRQVAQRIGDSHVEDAQDWLDHGEWGLAIDIIADGLYEANVSLDARERQELTALVQSIGRRSSDFHFLKLDT